MHDVEKLYLKKYTHSVKFMSRILKDYHAAEDVTQEAFLRAWKFYPTYDPNKGKLETWFNAILFNALRDYQRDARFGPKSVDKDISSEDVLQDLVLSEGPIKRDYLLKKIEEVSNPVHRDVIELFYVLGYTSTEISQVVHKITQSNVTTIVTRFKDSLKGG